MTLHTPPPLHAILDSPRLIALFGVGFILCAALVSALGAALWLACLLGLPLAYLLEGVILYLMDKTAE